MLSFYSAFYYLCTNPCVHLIVFISILFLIIFYYCNSTFGTWKKLNVPYVKPIPLFGNYLNVALCIDHPVDTYKKIYYALAGKKYGGYFQMRTPYLMVRDPEMINNILIKDFTYFCNRGIYSDFSTNPLTDNLFFMNNPKWKIMRSKLSPAFSSGKLKSMYDQIKGCSDEMMKYLHSNIEKTSNEIDVREILGKFSIDVIGTFAFGLKFNAVTDDNLKFYMYGKKLFAGSLRYFLRELCLMISPKLLKIVRLMVFPTDATEFFAIVFHETITHREENEVNRKDIIYYLMQARQQLVLNNDIPRDEKFTESQIVANAFAMLAAGFETVSTASSFCLHELALKKHIQDKVREEIKLQRLKHNGIIDSDFLKDLTYLDMVIAETLRKYPTTFAIFRQASETYRVPNDSLIIEKGQKINIPTRALHFDPQYYPDPEVFDPERFSAEEKAKRPKGVYLPFGDGPRICIGKRFAEMEMKLALVEILSKFEVEPCEKTEIPIAFSNLSLLLIPKYEAVWLKFNLIFYE